MQRKLATWTATESDRRVDRLLRLISHPQWLEKAAEITLSSKGAKTPGVDGISKFNLQERLEDTLFEIRNDLRSGNYQPSPARRIYIPKTNGKPRPLGIPTLRDRIVQRAMLMAMEPIWENDFHSLSYGFIMLNEFDQYLDKHYLSRKARNDRWYWNHSIKIGRKPAIDENRQWKPAVAYCRYADDFVLMVKGCKREAEVIRDQCRDFLEDKLKLKLSGDYSCSKIDKVEKLNQKLKGWSQFYRHTDFTAKVYSKIDRIVFWKLAHWLARKYRCSVKSLLMKWCKRPTPNQAKTWVLFGKTNQSYLLGASLFRLVSSKKLSFRWRLPESNPYIRVEIRKTVTSRYADVAMAVGRD